jgi:hypothetical protein
LTRRIKQWGYGKNISACEALSAVQKLVAEGYNNENPPPRNLMFSIRGRPFPLSKIQTYYTRKSIKDIFAFAARDRSIGAAPLDVQIIQQHETLTPDTIIYSDDPHSYDGSMSTACSSAPLTTYMLQPPSVFHSAERLIDLSISYCNSFVWSPTHIFHLEPEVHHLTAHGEFGNKMQDGIAAVLRISPAELATPYFADAFQLLDTLVREHHPMGLAQMYAVLCELAAAVASTAAPGLDMAFTLYRVLTMVIEHAAQTVTLAEPTHMTKMLAEILGILQRTTEVKVLQHACLMIMQSMIDALATAGLAESETSRWQLLYLKERKCDCLYHAGVAGERRNARESLLIEQENFYGPISRNVLWTLINVAEDNLLSDRPVEAERLYLEALRRAGKLEGFGRAKSRYGALEGLAKIAEYNASVARSQEWVGRMHLGSLTQPAQEHLVFLNRALAFYDQAKSEALSFGWNSRRFLRVSSKHSELSGMVLSLSVS